MDADYGLIGAIKIEGGFLVIYQAMRIERLDSLMSDIVAFNPPPDKADDSLAWAAHMAEIRRVAEKMMLDEVVYC